MVRVMSKSDRDIPIVTIVMPTYNQAKYLPMSVQSVLDQTFSNWELIIVDNFSTDATSDILGKYLDSRIKVLQIDNSGCIAKSRNLAINSAKSEWLAFLDSDDYWYPNKLNSIFGQAVNEVDFFYHNLTTVDEYSNVIDPKGIKSRNLKSPILKDLILNGNTIATSSVVVRRKLVMEVGGMSEKADHVGIEDYNTWLRISVITERYKLIPTFLGAYRKHSSNYSSFEDFKAPTAAIEEFLRALTPTETHQLNKNFKYLDVRTRYLNRNFSHLKQDLLMVIRGGTTIQKFKALWMFISLTRTSK
jgi:glycosyltransferase involved in cell wall biosynthesis